VGRAADLELLGRLVAGGAALVTITGTAGIGKTALAARFAELFGERARDEDKRVGWCDLSEARDAAGIYAAVARALGMPDAEGADDAETAALVARLLVAFGPALLVLDNFEQVAPHAGATVEAWLAEIPELQLVVTSRERLRVAGEIVHELEPLSLPQGDDLSGSEAATLWLARVRELCPTYAAPPGDAPAVGRLLRELDGLPLAIELAAARFGTLTPGELLQRLEQRLDVLGPGARAGRGRRSTLRGALDWSWSLLEPWERSAFAQCAVFGGHIAVDAAEAVLDLSGSGPGHDALEALQALRDKSLLIHARHDDADEPALAMYVSVRKYALEKLAALPEAAATFERHARYFLDHAERCAGLSCADPVTAARRLLAERASLLAVVERALAARSPRDLAIAFRILVALEEPGWHHGSPSAHLRWFDEAFAHPCASAVDPRVRAHALIARGRVAWRVGRIDTSEADLDAAVAIAVALGDIELESLARRFVALVLFVRGRSDACRAAAEHALRLAVRAGRPRLEGMAKAMLAFEARLRGEQERARRLIEEALDCFVEVGDAAFELTMRIERMCAYVDSAELEAARTSAAQALALNAALGLPPNARLLLGLGHAALEAADPEGALARYREARDAAQTFGERTLELLAAVCGAIVLFEQGRALEAQCELRDAIRSARRLGRNLYTGPVTALLAAVEARLGHFDEARELLAAAESHVDSATGGPVRSSMDVCHGFVDLALAGRDRANGDLPSALELEERARRRFEAAWAATSSSASRVAEVRILARLLGGALANDPPPAPASRRPLRLAADGRWFEPPGGPRVACASRPVMRRILLALAHRHVASPAHPVSAERLIEAGWPGERILPDAARNRLHVMVSRMRDLGLREVLMGGDSGYFLPADVAIDFG
jgi:predicted ATPase